MRNDAKTAQSIDGLDGRQREEAATRLLFIHTDAQDHSGPLKGGVRIVTSPSASVIMAGSKYACKQGEWRLVISAIHSGIKNFVL